MPAAAASSSWSGGQPAPSADGSASPVTAGLYALTGSPSSAIAASSAALSTVLPTPVSVPVTNSPRMAVFYCKRQAACATALSRSPSNGASAPVVSVRAGAGGRRGRGASTSNGAAGGRASARRAGGGARSSPPSRPPPPRRGGAPPPRPLFTPPPARPPRRPGLGGGAELARVQAQLARRARQH